MGEKSEETVGSAGLFEGDQLCPRLIQMTSGSQITFMQGRDETLIKYVYVGK